MILTGAWHCRFVAGVVTNVSANLAYVWYRPIARTLNPQSAAMNPSQHPLSHNGLRLIAVLLVVLATLYVPYL